MRFSRYIDNRVLNACIRPQLPKWCGPCTISETLQVLLGQYLCPHEIARSMNWKPEGVIKGMGTSAVISGIKTCSKGRLQTEILRFSTAQELWKKIKVHMKAKEVLYLHENGHHVLITGYIEEPKITTQTFLKGMDCTTTMQHLTRANPHTHATVPTPGSEGGPWNTKKHLVLKAEHNIKNPEVKGIGSIIVERELEGLFQELSQNSHRLHLVRVYKTK